jgi:dsRNA-specific ribonuclease
MSPNGQRLYQFQQWRVSNQGVVEMECLRVSKKTGRFVSSSTDQHLAWTPEVDTLLASECIVDNLPVEYAQFNLMIPHIIRHVEAYAVASQLHSNLLRHIPIHDINHIVTAISAASAGWISNYQRYEFLGDSLLKFIVSGQLYSENPTWPEGYLTRKKNSIISNPRLAKTALDNCLESFIILHSEHAKVRKWTPPLLSDYKNALPASQISGKQLADVIEALTGAFFIDSGIENARRVLNHFISEIHPSPPNLLSQPSGCSNFPELIKAEQVIGYRFKNRALLAEAFTHPSFHLTTTQSYQRLEFLGDAVLDWLLVQQLFDHRPELNESQMTAIKACLVNEYFLGFLCLDFSVECDAAAQIKETHNGTFIANSATDDMQLWRFIRCFSKDVTAQQEACQTRYLQLRSEVHSAMDGARFPWIELAKLSAEKFYSDIIESIIGAIFIDSNGDTEPCKQFIDRLGIPKYARRMIEEGVDLVSPRACLLEQFPQSKFDFTTEQSSLGFRCKVRIDGDEVASVDGCLNSSVAVILTAAKASDLMKSKKRKTTSL